MDSFNPYASSTVAEAAPETRADFIRKTYTHLALALAAFALLEGLLIRAGAGDIAMRLLGSIPYAWGIVLGGFLLVGWLASHLASSSRSLPAQYVGLALFVLAEALIFVPMVAYGIAVTGGTRILGQAGVLTGALVLAITIIGFTGGKDFSFLGGILKLIGILALGLIVASVFLGFSLGMWFSVAMVVFAGGSVLYDTSNVVHRYQPGQHVAASLALFSGIALMFYYILRILISLSGRD